MTRVTVEIGLETRSFNTKDIDEQWISEQIRNRRRDRNEPCIRVSIAADGAHIRLQSANCPTVTGSWNPNPIENSIFVIWKEKITGDAEISPGSLVSFLVAVRRLLH